MTVRFTAKSFVRARKLRSLMNSERRRGSLQRVEISAESKSNDQLLGQTRLMNQVRSHLASALKRTGERRGLTGVILGCVSWNP